MKYILIIFIFATFPLYLFAVSPNDQDEIDLANNLDKQADLYYKQGRHSDSVRLYKRSLAIREKIPPTETNACTNLTKTIGIGITNDKWARITISNDDVTKLLHSPEIETLVSQYSSIENVRKYMVGLQREFSDTTPAILAGRDIGTVVLPDAPIKFFLDASEKIRATRRETQNSLNTHASSSKNIQATINERDNVDRSRTISPLRRATDAIILETGINTIEEMVTLATQHIDNHSA